MKLTIRDLSCGYDPERPVLEHLRFDLRDHEICTVLGANGVGKTTLFKTLLRFLPVQKGQILLDGEDLSGWSAMKQAKNIAYVAQSHVPPFPYLAGDVVMLGRVSSTGYFKKPAEMDRMIVRQAMEDMGIWHLREKSYMEISGGERQLVMMARALAQEPRILILDEPTTGLDYGNQMRVLEKICELKEEGYGIMMTTHDPEHAFLCDATVLLVKRDAPAEFGPAEQVLTERAMKELYGIDLKIIEFYGEDGELHRTCSPQFASVQKRGFRRRSSSGTLEGRRVSGRRFDNSEVREEERRVEEHDQTYHVRKPRSEEGRSGGSEHQIETRSNRTAEQRGGAETNSNTDERYRTTRGASPQGASEERRRHEFWEKYLEKSTGKNEEKKRR